MTELQMAKPTGEFTSKSSLSSGPERFLSRAVAHALDHGWRSADDFLRQFTPVELMRGLDAAPELRGTILHRTIGFHERIARKRSAQSAAEDLRIGLEEGVTTPQDIVSLVSADDRVRYLDRVRLFAFAIEPKFFVEAKSGSEQERAVERMAFLLEAALGESLITLTDFTDSITFETLARSLSADDLRRVVEAALHLGRDKEPLTEERLLAVVPLRAQLTNLPLDLIWSRVILAKVAEPSGFIPKGTAPAMADDPPDSGTSGARSPFGNGSAKEAAPILASESSTGGVEGGELEEDAARRRVLDRLSSVGRLPPRHSELSTQILFEIDSMYVELGMAANDEEREEAIRDSFPNEQHLATALLALIELLEPTLDVNDPELANADVDSLINVFLLDEQDQRERTGGAKASEVPSSEVPSGVSAVASVLTAPPSPPKRTVPPPLPRGAGSMPPALPPPPAGMEKSR